MSRITFGVAYTHRRSYHPSPEQQESDPTNTMPDQFEPRGASWSGLPYLVDGILCLFGAVSLAFLIGLTEEFHQHGTAGNESGKQLASVLGFVALAQACELADRIWRLCCCCTPVTRSDVGRAVVDTTSKSEGLRGVAVPCGCLEAADDGEECFADDEKSPERLCFVGGDNRVDHDEGAGRAPARGRYRCELPLQAVKRARGEYRVAKVRQVASVAVIEDLDLIPKAAESNGRVGSAEVAYDADCDSDSNNIALPTVSTGSGRVFVDKCDGEGLFVWNEE